MPLSYSLTFDHPPAAPRLRIFAAVLFVPLLSLWTWKLLEPSPFPESVQDVLESLSVFVRFLMAKCLHAGGYATLAFLGCVWGRTSTARWCVLGFLLLHGIGSELAQHLLEWGRSGKVVDVAIDWVGTAAGIVVWGRFASRFTDDPRFAHLGAAEE